MREKLEKLKAPIAVALIGLLIVTVLVCLGITLQQVLITLHTGGNIETEYGLEANPTSIDWGNITLNVPVDRDVTIINNGTVDIDTLDYSVPNMDSIIHNYTLTWTGQNKQLLVGDSLATTFTLTVYEAENKSFTFDIYIGE